MSVGNHPVNEYESHTFRGDVGFYGVAPAPQPSALTAEDASTVDTTYGAEEVAVIGNLRTRVGELEAALQAYGLLP